MLKDYPADVMEILIQATIVYFFYGRFIQDPRFLHFNINADEWIDFWDLTEEMSTLAAIVGAYFLFIALQTFKFLMLNKSTLLLYLTVKSAGRDLFLFFLSMTFLLVGFTVCSQYFYGFTDMAYHNFETSFNTLLNMMLGEYDSSQMIAARPRANWIFFTLYVFSFTLLVMNCIIAILTSAFENVKNSLRSTPSYTNESYIYRCYKSFILFCFKLEDGDSNSNMIVRICRSCFCCNSVKYSSRDDEEIVGVKSNDDNKSDSFKVHAGAGLEEMIRKSRTGATLCKCHAKGGPNLTAMEFGTHRNFMPSPPPCYPALLVGFFDVPFTYDDLQAEECFMECVRDIHSRSQIRNPPIDALGFVEDRKSPAK